MSLPIALSFMFSINCLVTDNATSASSKALRISLNPSITWVSLSEGAFFKELKIYSNLFVKFSNIFPLFQQQLH